LKIVPKISLYEKGTFIFIINIYFIMKDKRKKAQKKKRELSAKEITEQELRRAEAKMALQKP